jgi:hypothetical protein
MKKINNRKFAKSSIANFSAKNRKLLIVSCSPAIDLIHPESKKKQSAVKRHAYSVNDCFVFLTENSEPVSGCEVDTGRRIWQ